MTEESVLTVAAYLLCILLLVKPLGWYMARVYEDKFSGLDMLLKPFERLIYRCCGVNPEHEMGWKTYSFSILFFNLLALFAVYSIQRLQHVLPLNTEHFAALSPDLAFNVAAGFTASADWQSYSGESVMSYFNQVTALTVIKFIAAGTGMSVLIAFIRGLTRHDAIGLGNFWVDLVRSILYILLPLSLVFAIIFSSQGVIQNFKPYQKIDLLESVSYQPTVTDNVGQARKNQQVQMQVIPMGPVASSLAIEQFAVNGGGFFNVNNAHPFENPNPLTNFLEMLVMILIPAASCYTFGMLVKDKRQGWAILVAMLLFFLPCVVINVCVEQAQNPLLTNTLDILPGGNMEGKDTRFGIIDSALWSAAATATASGSNNAMLDSFTPIGGLISLWLMHTGEVIFGGAGSGLYSMLMLIIVSVFIAGLMVGRSPEYLGKKIGIFDMKMAVFSVLILPTIVLFLTAAAVLLPAGVSTIGNPGAHGLTEILYTFTSQVSTNGSSMAGLNANTPFYNTIGGYAMLFGRYWTAIPVLAVAGSLARKKKVPISSGTLPTHTLLFIMILLGVITILGALTFFPVLALGPIADYFLLLAKG